MTEHAAAVAIATDVVALALGTDAADPTRLRFLATRRQRSPFPGSWALPGQIISPEDDLESAARSALADAGVRDVGHLEQLATFGQPHRDPRGRIVSVTYLALLPRADPDAPTTGGGDARWMPAQDPPSLAFDHARILASAVERLQGKLSYSTVAYGLLDAEFTLTELQAVYEAVLGRAIDKRNFRKKVLAMGMLTETGRQRRGPHRPAQLYRFARPGLELLDGVITV